MLPVLVFSLPLSLLTFAIVAGIAVVSELFRDDQAPPTGLDDRRERLPGNSRAPRPRVEVRSRRSPAADAIVDRSNASGALGS